MWASPNQVRCYCRVRSSPPRCAGGMGAGWGRPQRRWRFWAAPARCCFREAPGAVVVGGEVGVLGGAGWRALEAWLCWAVGGLGVPRGHMVCSLPGPDDGSSLITSPLLTAFLTTPSSLGRVDASPSKHEPGARSRAGGPTVWRSVQSLQRDGPGRAIAKCGIGSDRLTVLSRR